MNFLTIKLCNHVITHTMRSIQNCCIGSTPKHLICFKDWTGDMIMEIINSALRLKCNLIDTHGKRLDLLENSKIMILQEVNAPVLNMAVSKAATLLGADAVNIVDRLIWNHDYNGRVFSFMADAIFVATSTHTCLQRFAKQSLVPVICMTSRTHSTIQAMATIMTIIEEFGTIRKLNIAYFGSPHPVLNSYLLLCPILGANIKFKCSCSKQPVSPLLYKAGETLCSQSHTSLEACTDKNKALCKADVIIAGPENAQKLSEFKLCGQDIEKLACPSWIFLHTCPRGKEVDDNLFFHDRARTFKAFENFQYIAAALMASTIKDHTF
ncbi:ornithine transcarbamylase, mitochondrial-like [Pieris rapae]|uniref:ornithine transcarbamylase, mitochondrial-like n=1 Tax=Pieris rapae TaxID=64459 RepID=UPI001E280DC0|nr:ornithine transcarbamylase, mitochondrial-like [Pieris rapae]